MAPLEHNISPTSTNYRSLVEFSPAQELWLAFFDGEGSFDLTTCLPVLACGDCLEGPAFGVVFDGNGYGALNHTGHVELVRGPVCRARVVREVCFGDLDPCFGQLEGLLSPVDCHDGLQVRGDEGQKAGS